jgi:hypothetical protein
MLLSDLIAQVRSDFINDQVQPYRWSDDQLTRYALEGVSDACKRTTLIRRVYSIAVSVGNPDYTIDTSVRQILSAVYGAPTMMFNPLSAGTGATFSVASVSGLIVGMTVTGPGIDSSAKIMAIVGSAVTLSESINFTTDNYYARGDSRPLLQTTAAYMEEKVSATWRTITGTPRAYIRTRTALRLDRIPIANDTLYLTTSNTPSAAGFDFAADIDDTHSEGLNFYVAYKAFSKRGESTYNLQEAQANYGLYEGMFGPKHSAKYDEVMQDTPAYQPNSRGRMA